MKTQHTPGPWKEDKYGCVIDAGGRVVCNEFCTTSIPLAESLANARLIAAAPELFAIIEESAEMLSGNPSDEAISTVLAMLHSALAKAKAEYPTMNNWIEYPLPLDARGNFVEDLELIAQLLGSICYETETRNGLTYIRRVDQ